MSLCPECGNILVVQSCSPVCLVCQHTGRAARIVLEPKPVQQPEEVQMRELAAALDAAYADAKQEVIEAQQMLRHRIRNFVIASETLGIDGSARIGKRFDQEQRDREPVCQSCNGTGRWMNRHCPDCYEPDERE